VLIDFDPQLTRSISLYYGHIGCFVLELSCPRPTLRGGLSRPCATSINKITDEFSVIVNEQLRPAKGHGKDLQMYSPAEQEDRYPQVMSGNHPDRVAGSDEGRWRKRKDGHKGTRGFQSIALLCRASWMR
jgi:hypothetical protein